MNHSGSHQGHMWLIGTVAVAALLFGYGVGSALALVVIACVVMLGAIIWYVGRSEPQLQHLKLYREDDRRH